EAGARYRRSLVARGGRNGLRLGGPEERPRGTAVLRHHRPRWERHLLCAKRGAPARARRGGRRKALANRSLIGGGSVRRAGGAAARTGQTSARRGAGSARSSKTQVRAKARAALTSA